MLRDHFIGQLYEEHGLLDMEGCSEEHIHRMTELKCLCCGKDLLAQENVVVILTNQGVMASFCSGPCMDDLSVLGWMQEKYDDIVDSVKFRSGAVNADSAEE